uniref:Ig-like domain-containing protein n=1 Tax=Bos indicus x Bos taurus TaxID=30522 RepID=A0A4W2CZD5_BOBOX
MPLLLLLLLPVVWEAPLAQRLELRQNVTVQEGLCVFVPCRFSLPWVSFGKFYMFWFRERADTKRDPPVATNKPEQKLREGTQGRFSVPGEPQAGNCSLSITDVNAGDSGTYFFQVETHFRKYAYLNKMLFLNVIGTVGSLRERKGHGKPGLGWGRHDKTPGQANKMPRGPALSFSLPSPALTHQPHVRSPGALEPGRPGNLTCSVPWACERATPPIFSWTSAAPSSLGPRTPFSSVITLTPRPQDHGTRLTCQVKFPTSGVMVKRTILLNVTYAPQHVAISIFQGNRTGKRQPWAGKVLGAVGGAGITVLLSLCLYLIFRVKTHRKTQPVQSMDDTNQAGGSGSRERQPQFWTDTPADHPAPAGAGPISRNEQELHYAFLQFHKPKPQKQESTHTEYSEIKIHK